MTQKLGQEWDWMETSDPSGACCGLNVKCAPRLKSLNPSSTAHLAAWEGCGTFRQRNLTVGSQPFAVDLEATLLSLTSSFSLCASCIQIWCNQPPSCCHHHDFLAMVHHLFGAASQHKFFHPKVASVKVFYHNICISK